MVKIFFQPLLYVIAYLIDAITFLWYIVICFIAFVYEQFTEKKPEKKRHQHYTIRCLITFHGMSPETATDKVSKYLKDNYLAYYTEPFQVANDITGHKVELSLEEYKERYVKGILGYSMK